MKIKLFTCCIVFIVSLLLSACAEKKEQRYTGPDYAPTTTVSHEFRANQVSDSCRVFAHLLTTIPAQLSGREISNILTTEAKKHGADVILVGNARKTEDDDVKSAFTQYFGPAREYLCKENWSGWRFGYDVWDKQDYWVSFGFREWDNEKIKFDHPIMIQSAFLRCR